MPEQAGGETLGRAERNRLHTRERLYNAAVSLIAERGYDATTMSDIAERADTARGTAFNHFPTKGAFAVEWHRRRRQEAAAVAAHAEDIGTRARIRVYFAHLASVNERERALTANMLLGWLHAEGPVRDAHWLGDDLIPWIEAGQRTGEIDPTVEPHVPANLLLDGYLGVLYRWMADEHAPRGSLDHIATTIDLVLTAIARR